MLQISANAVSKREVLWASDEVSFISRYFKVLPWFYTPGLRFFSCYNQKPP